MKKMMSKLLVTMLFFTAIKAGGPGPNNKTFLMPRDQGTNMVWDFTTWHRMINADYSDKKHFGARVMATVAYQESGDDRSLGKYFGWVNELDQENPGCSTNNRSVLTRSGSCDTDCNKSSCDACCDKSCDLCGCCEKQCSTLCKRQCVRDYICVDLDAESLCPFVPCDVIHDNVTQNQTLKDNIVFRPEQKFWMLKFVYLQRLDELIDGLFFRAALPIVFNEHSMDARSAGPNTTQSVGGEDKSFADYLRGDIEVTSGSNAQKRLNKLRICTSKKCATECDLACRKCDDNSCDTCCSRSVQFRSGSSCSTCPNSNCKGSCDSCRTDCETKCDPCCDDDDDSTDVADIRLELGYDLARDDNYHASIRLNFTIPTSSSPNSRRLFEAQSGNGGHFEFGTRVDAHHECVWSGGDLTFGIHGAVDYMYVFESDERRVLGFKTKQGDPVDYGWYILGGEVGQAGTFPLANVLCRKVDVEPGSKLEILAAASLDWVGVTLDLGYDYFWREREHLALHDCDWCDDTFGVAKCEYNASNEFTNDDVFTLGLPSAKPTIQAEDLDLHPARTASYRSHKIFAGLGYTFHNWDTPFGFGIGGHYEWGEGRVALDTWSVWGKLSLAF